MFVTIYNLQSGLICKYAFDYFRQLAPETGFWGTLQRS